MSVEMKSSVFVLYLLLTSTLIDMQIVRSYSHTVTLTDKVTSFVAYESFNSSRIVRLSFRFKTYCLHCLLLYVDNTKAKTENRNYLLVTLLKGKLHVDVHKDSRVETLKKSLIMSRNLNDVQWHHIDIKISDRKSLIRVDNESRTLADDNFALSSLLYFGGVEHAANISAAVSLKAIRYIQRFVGCISSVMFTKRNGDRSAAHEIKRNEASTGCLDACTKTSCHNKGTCLNMFTKTSCDCIGTGYQGPTCTRAVSDAVFLNKTDYIGVNLDADAFKLRMRFRTRSGEGLLLATSKRGKGFYVAVVDGSIRVSIDHERGFFFGSGTLHDTQWHFLVVSLSSSMIHVELDGKYNESRQIGKNTDVMTSPIYIGGLPYEAKDLTPVMPTYFVGCLQQIYIDDINIVYKLIRSYDRRVSSTKTLQKSCSMKQEKLQEALRRISAEKRSKTTVSPIEKVQPGEEAKASSKRYRNEPTEKPNEESNGDGYAKLAVESKKDLIAWISSGVVSGMIVLMIMTACAIHYFKYKYENIFVSRVNQRDSMQEQQQTVNNAHMLPKHQAVVFLQDRQMSKVVNL